MIITEIVIIGAILSLIIFLFAFLLKIKPSTKIQDGELNNIIQKELSRPPLGCYWEVNKVIKPWRFTDSIFYDRVPLLRISLVDSNMSIMNSSVNMPLVDKNNNILSKEQLKRILGEACLLAVSEYNKKLITNSFDGVGIYLGDYNE